ncbi:MAG: hypothetical protein HY874_06635 [Chloroflexi bacterium]|nr:hypothetical protein [Chloroflexota bacterium]
MTRPRRTSDVGTALARFNALRHGVTSTAPVIPGVESAEEWEAHREAVAAALAPQGAIESILAERIALLAWRIQRVARYECSAIAAGRERVEFDYARSKERTDDPPTVAEAENRLEDARRCLKVIESLLETPPDTPLASIDAEKILEDLADSADELVEDLLEGIEAAEPGGLWTSGRLVAVFEAIAARDGDVFAELLGTAIARGRTIARGWELEVARIGDEIDRMRDERLLPEAATLDRLIRYEGSLNRMLYQALNQLEATQSRRTGAPTALHRIQAFGLPGG